MKLIKYIIAFDEEKKKLAVKDESNGKFTPMELVGILELIKQKELNKINKIAEVKKDDPRDEM